MSTALSSMAAAASLLPHGYCFTWQPGLVWSHVVADALIALAYFSIPVVLLIYQRQRPQLSYSWVLMLFASFITLCGFSHVFGIITIWQPLYGVEAGVKLVTALVSLITAGALIPLLPKLLSMKSADELEHLNQQLMKEVQSRREIETRLATTIDELRRTNRDLEQFTSVASHDLKAPLRNMAMASDLLMDVSSKAEVSDDARQMLGIIKSNATRMTQMVEDLLDLARIDTSELPDCPCEVTDVVVQAMNQLEVIIEESQAQIHYDKLPAVHGDPSQLIQLFQNLLGNAIKFQPQDRRPEIHISAELEGGFWVFCVADNGIGLNLQFAKDIFKPFRRLHGLKDYAGNGIGLSICRKIVEHHGGRIWVESTPDQGSRFYFSLCEWQEKPAPGFVPEPVNIIRMEVGRALR